MGGALMVPRQRVQGRDAGGGKSSSWNRLPLASGVESGSHPEP
jgi:hypothetical protein